MRVAVAGGTGFLGRALVDRLVVAGHDVVLLARHAAAAPSRPRVRRVAVDLVGDPAALAAALDGCDAVVNLVGVKRAAGGQDFERAHVGAVTRLIDACKASGVDRLIHVSVVGAHVGTGPYMASKWRGEQAVIASGLAWTIVRPGVIAGHGDDFITNLAAMIRHMAVFPGPDGGAAEIQPVLVDDVAAALLAALTRPETVGTGFDVVGPERLPLRAWVKRVAAALALPTWVVPVPARLLAPAVAVLELLPAPPLTRAQLGMLARGMVGEPAPASLGLAPRALDAARIAALAADIGPWLGVSLRILHDAGHRAWLADCARALPRIAVLVPLAALLIAGLRAATPDIWRCMVVVNLVLVPAALLAVPLPWRALLRPRLRDLAFGTGAAVVLYGLGWLGAAALRSAAPGLMADVGGLYAWGAVLPLWQALPLLGFIVLGEELFWRAAIALPVAGRWGPWAGVAAASIAFTLAHVAVGPPVLWLASAACGAAWAWLVVRTRSLWPGLVCHWLWDVAVMFVAPY